MTRPSIPTATPAPRAARPTRRPSLPTEETR